MTEKMKVSVRHRFKASAERVYDAWLDPSKVRVWMKTAAQSLGLSGDIRKIEIDPKVGGRFLFSDMREGIETKHWGTYRELERPHKIVFSWITDESEETDPGIVTLTIQPEEKGCSATIVHEMDAKWAEYVKQTDDGWSCMQQAIDQMLEG